METEVEKLKAENMALKKRVLQETIQRLSAERQAAQSSLVAIQMRIPQIEQEMTFSQNKLAELTKEQDGSAGH